jgi:CHASE2 domain-containing sensor protein
VNSSPVKWIVRLTILHKLGGLFGRLLPSRDTLARLLHRFRPGFVLTASSSWWKQRSRFVRQALTNFAIGMVIALFLVYLHHLDNPWLTELEDAGLDWMMQIHAGTTVSENAIPIAWIEIDEHTYRAWGEPLFTPRARLAKLIEYAADSEALAIVVDIDLSRRSGDSEGDRALQEYLENHAAGSDPPLLLARTFRNPPDGSSHTCREVRTSFLETDGSLRKADEVFWASTLFTRDRDRVIRRWRLWEPACTEDGRPVIVPSIQLLAAAIATDTDAVPAAAVAGISNQLQALSAGQCSGHSPPARGGTCGSVTDGVEKLDAGGLSIDTTPSHIQQRLIYSIPWQGPASGRVIHRDSQKSLFVRHSAYPITAPGPEVDRSWLSGRIVIIGSSYADARDSHATPIGEQPGALILANAIHSLVQYGQIEPPEAWQKLLIEAFLILIMSLAFARFHSFWGMLVSGTIIILVLLPASFMLFKYGVWLDFAIPLIAVQLHQMAAEFEESRKQRT